MRYESQLMLGVAPLIFLVVGAIPLMLLGSWFWIRSRARERGDGGSAGAASSPSDPGGAASPTANTQPSAEHTSCDWELHYWNGTEWEVLRSAPSPAVTCCVYKVKVETRIARHEQATRFHEDIAAERLCFPDHHYSWRSLDLDADASTRSGPSGRLDWMDGLGDPIERSGQVSDDADSRSAEDQELPEVAAHLTHHETTRVSISLEPGCPHPDNTYTASGDSSLSVLATQECTNDGPSPECPVELSSLGWHWGEVWGELDWVVHDGDDSDSGELERLVIRRQKMDPEQRSDTPARIPVSRTGASHDHDTERRPYEAGDFDAGSDTTTSLTWTTWIRTEVELDTGQLVPRLVWPTTDRVTTHIEQQMTHTIEVRGEMEKGDCDTTGCCTGNPGHVCNCAPEFALTIDSAGSMIVVDGSSIVIERDPPSADRRTPPVVGSPPAYRAWKVA